MRVKLAPHEVALATAVGQARRASAVARGRPARYGFAEGDPEAADINAAGGELAAAIAYGLPWTGCYYRSLSPKPADIGQGTEVRTRTKDWHSLIVHPEDPNDWSFVLVQGWIPEYEVVGHIFGQAAKLDCWWKDPAGGRPAYFVPGTALTPIKPVRLARAA